MLKIKGLTGNHRLEDRSQMHTKKPGGSRPPGLTLRYWICVT